MALCVNPTDTYCRFKAEDGRVYIMAKALMETVFPEQKFEVLAEMPGTALKGMEYVPLFDFAVGKLDKKAWFVVCDNYVTMTGRHGHRPHCSGVRRGRQPRLPRERRAVRQLC